MDQYEHEMKAAGATQADMAQPHDGLVCRAYQDYRAHGLSVDEALQLTFLTAQVAMGKVVVPPATLERA